MRYLSLLLFALVFTGCMNVVKPTQNLINSKAVRQIGEANLSRDKDYILYIPAGKKVKVVTQFKGNAFQSEKIQETHLALTKSIYLYKNWVSYDKKAWYNAREIFAFKVQSGLGVEGAKLSLSVSNR